MATEPEGMELDSLAPTPQEYGFPIKPTSRDVQVWHHQEAFLEAFRRCGKIGIAARAIGLTRWAVDRWLRTDQYTFKKRMEDAHADYVELLEEDMDNFIEASKHNTQIARIFRLRAEHPEKYREEVKVLGVSAPLQMLDKLRGLAAKDMKAREALEAPAIEGEFKEVAAAGEERPVQSAIPAPEPPKKTNKPSGRVRRR
jgi:hypothetical protein